MKTITLDHITKIEGHASLKLRIDKDKVKVCELGSIVGARFFEGLLPGRPVKEAVEITSRICGICSCAHTICCLKAVENALGIKVSEQTAVLRELITSGERIRSHASHLYFFALPDYFGYESAIQMAGKNKEKIMTALNLIKIGNEIVRIFGGRDMHPFTSIEGGFTYVPDKEELKNLLKGLRSKKEEVIKTIQLFEKLNYPRFGTEREFMCMSKDTWTDEKIISNKGFETRQEDYEKFIEEKIEAHSTAKFAVKKEGEYMVGALARLSIIKDLDKEIKSATKKSQIKFPSNNPFHNNFAQAVEILYWINRAIAIMENNEFKKEEIKKPVRDTGRGIGAIEAPRGLLFHDYTIKEGVIEKCNIITPTCQNLAMMELDIKNYVEQILEHKKLSKEKLVLEIEKLIRAYDPCFSCSTHFLEVRWV